MSGRCTIRWLCLRRRLIRFFVGMVFCTSFGLFIYHLKMTEQLQEINERSEKSFIHRPEIVKQLPHLTQSERLEKPAKHHLVLVEQDFTERKWELHVKLQEKVSHFLRSQIPHNKTKHIDLCSSDPKNDSRRYVNIHTYDLPDRTNYSLQRNKNYVFSLSNEKVAYKADLSHLEIIIVPFSHVDPGYGMTFERYYRLFVKGILDSMVQKLNTYKDMTFQWAEVVFLERWWRDIDVSTKLSVRKLIREGQLEIVLGGWVMPDEAVTTADGLIDQLLEGHQWLQDKLSAIPETSWSNDPFGYSEVMSFILASSGIRNMVILRVHQAIKATLAEMGAMEFKWIQYSRSNIIEADTLCHIMPYTGYWIRDVCGPNKALCKEYAFMHTVGDNIPIWINDENVADRARLLHEQYRITAELYKFQTLYIGLGEDFSYSKPTDWDLVHTNFMKLMDYMNDQKTWNVSIKFGTLKEYFRKLRDNVQTDSQRLLPAVSGDFFPYSDWNNDYWTGFYTTRPFQKHLSREVGRLIRIADVYLVFIRSHSRYLGNSLSRSVSNSMELSLRGTRRAYYSFLHHDGITGTSTQEVAAQYGFQLYQAYISIMSVLKRLVMILMSKKDITYLDVLDYETFRESSDSIPEKISVDAMETKTKLFIVNPLPRKRTAIVSLKSSSEKIKIVSRSGKNIKVQTNSILKALGAGASTGSECTFALTLPPYAIESLIFTLGKSNLTTHCKDAKEFEGNFISIGNGVFSAKFNSTTGMLVSITDSKGRKTRVRSMFLWYETINSGAYVFKPLSHATQINLDLNQTTVRYFKGEIFSEVRVLYSEGICQSFKIYNTTTVKGHGLHIKTEINIRSSISFWANKEVVFRIKTDVKTKGHFYSDQNGLRLIGRKTRKSIPIGGNFYPVATMVMLEDRNKRLTLHTGQPHGVASLGNGWLEIMLDRTMVTDDQKGLGQGIMDNKLTVSHFVLQVEYDKSPRDIQDERYAYETQLASLINEDLQHPVISFFEKTSANNLVSFVESFRPLEVGIPFDTIVLGLRNLFTEELEYNGTSLILFQKSFQCGFSTEEHTSDDTNQVTIDSFFPFSKIKTADETSLTHLHKTKTIFEYEDLRPQRNLLRSFRIKFN